MPLSHASPLPLFRNRNRRGMSLLEALATLVLVAVLVPAAMQAVTISLRAAQQARQQQEASLLAESRLNEVIAARDATGFTGSGSFSPESPDYRWELQSAPGDFGMTEVWITVTWQQRGQERSLTLTTYVYLPQVDDSEALGGA